MKFIQIINALPSLNKLREQELSIKNLYKISKLMGNLEGEIAFYNQQRNKIMSQYCDIEGNQYVPREADVEKLNAEIGDLLNTEIECEIKEVVISTDENIKLSYNDLVKLKGFIKLEIQE